MDLFKVDHPPLDYRYRAAPVLWRQLRWIHAIATPVLLVALFLTAAVHPLVGSLSVLAVATIWAALYRSAIIRWRNRVGARDGWVCTECGYELNKGQAPCPECGGKHTDNTLRGRWRAAVGP